MTTPEPARESRQGAQWLLLAFQLPAQPAYLRVKVWRRLQDVGAVSFRNALYVLPRGESAQEDFEWILREITSGGGSGAIFEAHTVAGMTDDSIRALFDAAREVEYAELEEELQSLAATVNRRRPRADLATLPEELTRIRRRLAEIEALDFFNSSGRLVVHGLLRELEARATTSRSEKDAVTDLRPPANLKGRVWVTRAHVKVDRMASAWLIRRWIDPDARFKFTSERAYRPAETEVRFDMFDGEFTHEGDRCTFEVLASRLDRPDPALRKIAEIVHDLDLKESRYEHEETAGVGALLAGIAAAEEDDARRLERSARVFDDLYAAFARARG
jgi:hypothetical protein